MKFKFSKNLDYQLDAINAIVDTFDSGKNIIANQKDFKLEKFSPIIANELEMDDNRILKNIQIIQKKNKIEVTKPGYITLEEDNYLLTEDGSKIIINTPNLRDFSIEMETGTGKTYVYLRTIFELNQKYGLKKFIILVPSVAIREGVLKTLEQTKEHFKELYNTNFGYFAYDSDKLPQVRNFAQSLDVQIMIITIQSFNSDDNIMRQTPDRFNGESPINLVAQTNPVVIMDEPQNMGSELSKAAIADLNPLFKLRYSATHKELHNLMYRLTPIDAYKKHLVKRIRVFGVREDNPNALQLKLKEIITEKGKSPRARVLVEVKLADGSYKFKEILIKSGDKLEQKTKNEEYKNLHIENVNAQFNRLELSSGVYVKLEAESENKEQIFRAQIKETIKTHLDKQEELGNSVKVLSLFFIDKVDNYIKSDSLIRKIFEEEFNQIKNNYTAFKDLDASVVHKGYFASKKEKGEVVYKDTRGDTNLDKEAYDLIMKDKERLLSFSEPVSFIFSHSALKEGWDNPNIFQICTLRETNSPIKKRQEIGRGLRLPVNVQGDRIYDPETNILTVIANESYEEYASQLQQEFTDAGYAETPDTDDARANRVTIKTSKNLKTDDFHELWNRINKRTRFNLELKTDELVERCVGEINKRDINNLAVVVEKRFVYFDEKNRIETTYGGDPVRVELENEVQISNLLDRIARETKITRKTVYKILSQIDNLDLVFKNPEEFTRAVVVIINECLNNIVINEGLKYIPTGEAWEVNLIFSDFKAIEKKSIASDKSVYTRVAYDSEGEMKFAQSLENNDRVKLYTKLPSKFEIDTPLGKYNPDWAIVWKTEKGEKLYLVRETKFKYHDFWKEISDEEKIKILCGEKHFKSIGVNFEVSTSEELDDLETGQMALLRKQGRI